MRALSVCAMEYGERAGSIERDAHLEPEIARRLNMHRRTLQHKLAKRPTRN